MTDQAEKVKSSDGQHSSSDYSPYPKLDPKDVAPIQENWGTFVMGSSPSDDPSSAAVKAAPSSSPKSVSWSPELENNPSHATTMPQESNPYVSPSPAPAPARNTIETFRGVLDNWGKKMGEAVKEAEDLAGNVWQHLKTGPSVADAAMGRIAQGTKVLAEGGYEKIFRQTFDTVPEEQLRKSYACYLSTSAGPVMGILYLSTAKLAFCSDNPLSYKVGDQTEWSYYKVVIDSCCATFAEVKKRGKDFWAEFELFLADLLVGLVVDIALVGLLAPYVRIGKPSVSKGFFGHTQRVSGALPCRIECT